MLVALGACSPAPRLLTAPDDVAFLALGFTRSGAWAGSTGIVERTEPTKIDVPDELADADMTVLGWTAELAEQAERSALASLRLREGDGCRNTFPAPAWVDGPAPQSLAADSPTPICDLERGARLAFDVRCAPQPCAPTLSQTNCRIATDTSFCGVNESLVFEVSPDGSLCQTGSQDCKEADADGIDRVVCESVGDCVVEARERRGALDADVDRIAIAGPEIRQVDLPWPSHYAAAATQVLDSELHPLGLVALTSSSGVSLVEACDPATPRTLTLVDIESLEVTSTSTMPPCLDAITIDPFGTGILTARMESGEVVVERRELDGRVVSHSALRTQPSERPWYIIGIEALAGRVFVGLAERSTETFSSALADARTLEPSPPGPVLEFALPFMAAIGRDVSVTDTGNERVVKLDPSSGTQIEGRRIRADRLEIGPAVAGPDGRWFIALLGEKGAVYAISEAEALEHARYFEKPTVPFALAFSPSGLLVGLVSGGDAEYEAFLARLDPATMRFESGAVPLGRGTVQRLHVAGHQTFALLGRTGEIVRVRNPAW